MAACMLNRLDISIRHFSIALTLLVSSARAVATQCLESLQRANWRDARAGEMGDHRARGRFPWPQPCGPIQIIFRF